jgi:hypothetical protein
MKKTAMIAVVVLLLLAFTVPAAFAHTPPGNYTSVNVNGWHNSGTVVVDGTRNHTYLTFGSKSKWNVGVIGVVGCGNTTKLNFGYKSAYNHVGVVVVGRPCR